jgi:hypothetical protein
VCEELSWVSFFLFPSGVDFYPGSSRPWHRTERRILVSSAWLDWRLIDSSAKIRFYDFDVVQCSPMLFGMFDNSQKLAQTVDAPNDKMTETA